MYIDGALVPAGLLVNDRSIVRADSGNDLHYFHIELDAHDAIVAEGAFAETFVDDDSRGLFQNVREFHALYPDARTSGPACFCAPRVEGGMELEIICRRLLARASRLHCDGTVMPQTLRAAVDTVGHHLIAGWAFDPATPEARVSIVVIDNGAVIGRVVADLHRPDLAEAGIGDGTHGFQFVVPGGLAPGLRHEIALFREGDWTPLAESPAVLEPIAEDAAALRDLRGSLGHLEGCLDHVSRYQISGWAKDVADNERRVALIISVNDEIIGRVLANRYRPDVEQAGYGDGKYGFEFILPSSLSLLKDQAIRVKREADGAELPNSPMMLPAASHFDDALERSLANVLTAASAGSGADEDRALAFLTGETERLLARRAERQSGRTEREAHRLFRRRWGAESNDARAAEAYSRRALVIDDLVPAAKRDAGSVAILSHIRALRALGYDVTFVGSQEMHHSKALEALAAAEGITACGKPHYSCVEDVLVRQAGTFGLVYLHRISNADKYLSIVRETCPKACVLYGVADLHHLRLARQAQVERRSELADFSRRMASLEIQAARRADIVVTHSTVEAEVLRELGCDKVKVVPFDVPSRKHPRYIEKPSAIAFIGSYGHAPNSDAVQYLIHEIMPIVWRADPTITCKVVGYGWNTSLLPGLDPRIEIVGAVDNLDALFDSVRLTVAPLRFGAGIKGKVLASLAAGVPCVMTPVAAEGLPLMGRLQNLIGRNDVEIAKRIVDLHSDERSILFTALDCIQMVADNFSSERVQHSMREAVPDRSVMSETIRTSSAPNEPVTAKVA
jgi:glycosyltransferase involved in cell wall biosynthesis